MGMSDYQLGIITGIIGLLIWQHVIVRLIRRFADMVMLFVEREPEAWRRLRGVIERMFTVAYISFAPILFYLEMNKKNANLFLFVFCFLLLVITVLRVNRIGWQETWQETHAKERELDQ